jgi:histone demethylase JARID1
VTKKKLWSDLGRILGYHGIPGLSTQLKNSYTRVILPFEEYEAKNASKEGKHSPPKKAMNGDDKRSRSVSAKLIDVSPAPDSPLTSTSSPLSEPPEDAEHRANGSKPPSSRPRRSTRMGSHDQSLFFLRRFCTSLTFSRLENAGPEQPSCISTASPGLP